MTCPHTKYAEVEYADGTKEILMMPCVDCLNKEWEEAKKMMDEQMPGWRDAINGKDY